MSPPRNPTATDAADAGSSKRIKRDSGDHDQDDDNSQAMQEDKSFAEVLDTLAPEIRRLINEKLRAKERLVADVQAGKEREVAAKEREVAAKEREVADVRKQLEMEIERIDREMELMSQELLIEKDKNK
ncbi:hypothetical protein HDV05_001744, partial [Chytridiales sp. JEL 0842]